MEQRGGNCSHVFVHVVPVLRCTPRFSPISPPAPGTERRTERIVVVSGRAAEHELLKCSSSASLERVVVFAQSRLNDDVPAAPLAEITARSGPSRVLPEPNAKAACIRTRHLEDLQPTLHQEEKLSQRQRPKPGDPPTNPCPRSQLCECV